jgi:hypothetical protein
MEVRRVDNTAALAAQTARLAALRASRDDRAVRAALDALEGAARAEQGSPGSNLLELAVAASRVRATVGEISLALERVWGRYEATGEWARLGAGAMPAGAVQSMGGGCREQCLGAGLGAGAVPAGECGSVK